MNPFEKAWRLLKNMGDDDPAFAEHRQMMEEMKQQEARLNEQRQAEQQRRQMVTPLQQQLDAKRAKEEQERNIFNLKREGKPRIKDYRQAVFEYYNTHGHYPRRTKKSVMRVVERMRERDD